jgi:ADP-ribose pyrophosphatase YjhB (NUDIX family)
MTRSSHPITIPREYPPVPLVGVAAAVFNEMGEVLLVERGRPPSQGMWGLPGGLLDLGESLADGVRREVWEECGVEIEIGGLADVFEPIQRDAEDRIQYHFVVIDFWARHISGDPIAQDDAAAVAWVAVDPMDNLPMSAETRAVIHKAHDLWLADQR